MNIPVTLAIVAALVAPLLTYLAAARRLSGRIATTDATVLWEESRAMRQDYIAQIKELREQLAACEKRVEHLHESNQDLDEELIRYKKKADRAASTD